MNPDDTPLTVDVDHAGKKRNPTHPTPGPFETPGQGSVTLPLR
ncbi:MAG: hypothetical protein U0736_25720 [Gemmataceae bacterium]